MRLLRSILAVLVFFLALSFYFPKYIFADCKGDYTVTSSQCENYCSTRWFKTVSKYDCPEGSAVVNGKRICNEDVRVFVCSYPEFYDNPGCPGTPVNNTNCGSTYCSKDANPNNRCGPTGTDPCYCGEGSVCVSQSYNPTQLCTGAFTQSTHGGCVAASCGYFCTSAGGCTEEYAYELTGNQQADYSRYGALNQNQCESGPCFIECNPGTQGVTDPEYDPYRCRICTGNGTWTPQGSDWGTPGDNTTQEAWCSCAQRYGQNFNSSNSNYAACFPTPAPVTPGPGTPPPAVACPGGTSACGDNNYGNLGNCSGNWTYANNSSYNSWCQTNASGSKDYCYTCSTVPTVCTPGQTQNVCSQTACVVGTQSTNP